MAVIDSDNFIAHLIWSGLIDKATCGELKEAIELCTVKDVYTKADMVAMLSEIQLEIEEVSEVNDYDFRIYKEAIDDYMKIIQAKINVLKGIEDGNAE